MKIDFSAFAQGLVPQLPEGATLAAMALIGTTIVPYNLFLHAAHSRMIPSDGRQYEANIHKKLLQLRLDNIISIAIGGFISIAIMAGAASAFYGQNGDLNNAADFARQLEPLFGQYARMALGIGLMGAGFSSSLTAAMATGYVVSEIMTRGDTKKRNFIYKFSALAIIIIGTFMAFTGTKPVTLILVAQSANGLLLPIIVIFLVWVANQKRFLGKYRNGNFMTFMGILLIVFTLFLGGKLLASAMGFLG